MAASASSFLDFPDNGNGWLFCGVFAAVAIVAFFEEGPGWLILKWLGRILLWLLMIPLAVLAWYTVAALPVSVAIILGAVIIVVGMRASTGQMHRLMGRRQETPEHERRDYPY